MLKRSLTLIILALLALSPQLAFAGILDLGQASEFVYKNVKERGLVVTMFSLEGKKALGGALKFGVLHNRAKTESYLAATVGIEAEIDDIGKGRLHLGAPVNVADVLRRLVRQGWISSHTNFVKIPEGWELWAGPFVRAPTQAGDKWQWKSHTGGFVSLGKKFGGE